MKKLLTFTFFLFSVNFLSAQYSLNELLKIAIKTHSLQEYNNKVVSQLDTLLVENVLQELNSKETFKSIFDSENKIKLTKQEKKFLSKSLRKQCKEIWNNEDFANLDVIDKFQAEKYLKNDEQNGVIYISLPIYIRNESIALILFANFHGEKNVGGISDFSFYRKENGNWKKWVTLISGIYN